MKQLMDVDEIVTAVAGAVGLAEGESGIRDILVALLSAEPAAVREVARLAELPVPIVAAACGELRKRGIVDTQRPVRLTPSGRDAVRAAAGGTDVRATCPACGGRGVVIPPELAGLAAELQPAADGAPGARRAGGGGRGGSPRGGRGRRARGGAGGGPPPWASPVMAGPSSLLFL